MVGNTIERVTTHNIYLSFLVFVLGSSLVSLFFLGYATSKSELLKRYLRLQVAILILTFYDLNAMYAPIVEEYGRAGLQAFVKAGLAILLYLSSGFFVTLAGARFRGAIRAVIAALSACVFLTSIPALILYPDGAAYTFWDAILNSLATPFLLAAMLIDAAHLARGAARAPRGIARTLMQSLLWYFAFSTAVGALGQFLYRAASFYFFKHLFHAVLLSWHLLFFGSTLLYLAKLRREDASFGTGLSFLGAQQKAIATMSKAFAKYEKSSLARSEAEKHLSKILHVMKTASPHRDPDLSLEGLAKLCGISRNHLSQVLNQYRRATFFDFVNDYRVKEAKRLLIDSPQEKSVLEIAFESGFNSKTAFYAAFKKREGLSPVEFRKGTEGS